MKVIIAGGRNYKFDSTDRVALDVLKQSIPITEVVSGGARGADTGGEEWAESVGIPFTRFLADWNKYGKRAGFIRNRQMAEYADAVVLFPGGNGTAHMKNLALEYRLLIKEVTRDKYRMDIRTVKS